MKASKRKEVLSHHLERSLHLPDGVLTTLPRMELSGNRRILIEGCKGIVEYDEDRICLRTEVGTVRFLGRSLYMHRLNPACAVITGRLLSVEFLE
ncbi:MAG: YabP/YqfC family sporulation protein [Clostridia bacterium]|nr:YabP/YqfC family sporulation protein [Clostridia bacterium]